MRIFNIYKIKNDSVFLYDDDIFHLVNVLRVKVNKEIFCSYEDSIYQCKIISIKPFRLQVLSKKQINHKAYPLNIYLGVIDKKYFEIAIKLLNELNCNSITPVFFSRSQSNIKLDYNRIEKIVYESNKQSQRIKGIMVNQPITFDQMLNSIDASKKTYILAYESECQNDIFNLYKKLLNPKEFCIIIGPEGGITIDEYNKLMKKNVHSVKLTNTILRAETACLYLSSIIIEFIKGNNNEIK